MSRRFMLQWFVLTALSIGLLTSPAQAEEAESPPEAEEAVSPPEAEEGTAEAPTSEAPEIAEDSTPETGVSEPTETTEEEDVALQADPPPEVSTPTEEVDLVEAHEQAHAEAQENSTVASDDEATEEGFFDNLSETDPAFTLRRGQAWLGLYGSVQILAVPFIDDPMASLESGSIANTEGFRLRRARFGVTGGLPYNFDFKLVFEHSDHGANILDAYLSYEPHPLARLTAGALKVPFSGIMMLNSEYQGLLQRPYIVRSIAPDRALGFEVSGRSHWVTYHLGVFNGGGDYYEGDNNAGMLYAARVALHALGPLPEGEITQPERLVFQLASSYYFNQDAAGNRHGVTGELVLRWSRLTLRGEFLWSTFSPASDPETGESPEFGTTTRLGFFAEVGVFIINEHLQISLRGEGQRIVEGGFEVEDLHDLWAISPAISGYFLQGRIKLMLQYEHRHEWFDEQVRNDYLALQVQGRI